MHAIETDGDSMKLFLTKVWGFNPEDYPVLGFNREGGRRKYLRESRPGDWIVLAGTRGAPTPPEQRGRLLGRVQLGTQELDVEEVLRSLGAEIPRDQYLRGGRYRWPYGLPMIEAERYNGLPDLAEVCGGYLPGTQWASYAIDVGNALGSDVLQRIQALPTEPANVPDVPAITRQRERQRALARNRREGPTGPGPSERRRGADRNPGEASAYMLRLEGGRDSVFKIGYSGEVTSRVATFNKALLPGITGFSWKLIETIAFESEDQAYQFEQEVHKNLRKYRADPESEIYFIGQREIETAWKAAFYEGEWLIRQRE